MGTSDKTFKLPARVSRITRSTSPLGGRALAALAVTATLVIAPDAGASNYDQPSSNDGPMSAPSRAGDLVPGEIIVRFNEGITRSDVAKKAAALDGAIKRSLGMGETYTLKVPKGTDTTALAERLNARSDVLWAEPNAKMELMAAPNDPRFGEMWGLHNTGQVIRGLTGIADVDADLPEAWNLTTGGDTVVAVVDSGVAMTHPDLAPNIWNNPGEAGDKKTNGVDDDKNGRIDDWRGWDFFSNDNDATDLNGHGTHVAGTIGAVGNNGIGITGVNWNVKIMPLRIGNKDRLDPAVNLDAAAAAMNYAGTNGAKVVNGSFGGGNTNQALEDAIAANPNTLFVFAAGNSSSDNDKTPSYPCNYNRPNIICVAAMNNQAGISNFSNFGVKSVDIAAPGGAILSTAPFTFQIDEPFETPLAGRWDKLPDTNGWGLVPTPSGEATKVLGYNNGQGVPGNTTAQVRSQQIDLTTCANPVLEFAVGIDFNDWSGNAFDGQSDSLIVVLSEKQTLDGEAYVLDAAGQRPYSPAPLTYDLTKVGADQNGQNGKNYAGKKPYLWFEVRTDGDSQNAGIGPRIDDVKVSCEPNVLQGTEYQYLDGTSMASPMVAGAAALVASQYPAGNMEYIRGAILSSAVSMPALQNKVTTGGRLDVLAALDSIPPSGPALGALADGAAVRDRRPVLNWDTSTDNRTGIRGYELFVDGAKVAGGDANLRSGQPGDLGDGVHTWRVDAIDGAGLHGASATRSFTVDATGPAVKISKYKKRSRRQLASRGFEFTASTKERVASFAATITLSAKDAKKLKIKVPRGAKFVTIGKATKKASKKNTATFKLKVKKSLVSKIRRARKKASFRITATAADGLGNPGSKTLTKKI
jgi:subtilisin family serine protease